MKEISRRKFIVDSGTVLALLQVGGLLEGCQPTKVETDKLNHGLRIAEENGLNVVLYFVNLQFSGGDLVPGGATSGSYILAQMPAQSLHESYFSPPAADLGAAPTAQQEARLSRITFLSFRLWPKKETKEKIIKFTPDRLLDWRNSDVFQLMTTAEVTLTADQFSQSPANVKTVKVTGSPRVITDTYYKETLLPQLVKTNGDHYLSLIELPQGLLLAPHTDEVSKGQLQIQLTQNNYQLAFQRRNHLIKEVQMVRTIRERWNMQLRYLQLDPKSGAALATLPPALRALAILTDANFNPVNKDLPCDPLKIDRKYAENYLPTLLDEAELVYLNQISNTDAAFDITGDPKLPFMLTASGATMKFSYHNPSIPASADYNMISLVGYEHHFQDGRDNYIKVSRIGAIAPTGQKALHVMVAERTIRKGKSFLLYYETIEIIEPEKTYTNKPGASADFQNYKTNTFYYNKLPFAGAKAAFTVTPRILPMKDAAQFWVYRESTTNNPPRPSDLLLSPFTYTDQNGKVLDTVENAIYFMRRDVFCRQADINQLLGTANPLADGQMGTFDDAQSLRIPMKNQVVAFTPDDATATNPDGTANKINQLETEFIDYVISVAKPSGAGNVFDTAAHVLYPQVTRAKVYVDHIQQYSTQKLASLINYHLDYLNNGLNSAANQAKLIIRHTDDFINRNILRIDGAAMTAAADLNAGYAKIQALFDQAGDKIGAVVNPSIDIQRFALARQAMTLPNQVNQQWASYANIAERKLQTLDIFNGSNPQIFNGISVRAILQNVLGAADTPLFDVNKITGTINDLDGYLKEMGDNPVVKATLADVKNIAATVKQLEGDVAELQSGFNDAKQQLTAAQQQLAAVLPEVNKLRNSCQQYFQQLELDLFKEIDAGTAVVQTAEDNIKIQIRKQATLAWHNAETWMALQVNLFAANAIGTLMNTVKLRIRNLDATVAAQIDQAVVLANTNTVSALYNSIRTTVPATIYADTLSCYAFDCDFADYVGRDGLYGLQTQLTEATATWLKDQTNGPATAALKDLQQKVAAKTADLSASIYGSIQCFLNTYQTLLSAATAQEQQILQQARQFFLWYKSAQVGYYVDQYRQYQKDFDDVWATIKQFAGAKEKVISLITTIHQNRGALLNTYLTKLTTYAPGTANDQVAAAWAALQANDDQLSNAVTTLLNGDLKPYLNLDQSAAFNALKSAQTSYDDFQKRLLAKEADYRKELQLQAEGMEQQLKGTFDQKLAGLSKDQILAASQQFQQAMALLKTPRQQTVSYQWKTQAFKPADLGIVRFIPGDNPVTSLNVDVRATVKYDLRKFPQVAVSVDTYSENTLTNFGISFFNVITIDFARISFTAGSGVSKQFGVKVQGVKFDGALSFIQLLEDLLGNLGDGFGITLRPDGVTIAYQSPTFGVSAPAFTFSNISIGVRLDLYFTDQPMLLTVALATPEAMATVSAGVYGGCFYCSAGIDPKHGIRTLEMALEMGAYLGISLGPIKGSVKFMVGLYYRRDDGSVTMTGYFVAEGTLSVWILSVSARLYMYVESKNSVVTGGCTVTYSVSLGFIHKDFSGSYSKTIAGAPSNHTSGQQASALRFQSSLSKLRNPANPLENLEDLLYAIFEEDTARTMGQYEWNDFYRTFY